MPSTHYSWTRPLHELKPGDNLPADIMQSLVDRANMSNYHLHRGGVGSRLGYGGRATAIQHSYPCYFMLVVGDLTLTKSDDVPPAASFNDDWVYADCMEWSFHMQTNRLYVNVNEHIERVYFPYLGTNTSPIQGVSPVNDFNDYVDFNDNNWANVLADHPCAIVCAHLDSDTGRMVSLQRPNPPRLINVELAVDIPPPTPPDEYNGSWNAYLLHYPPSTPRQLVRCQDSQQQDILVPVYSRACLPLKTGDKLEAEILKSCGEECDVGRYFLRWKPPSKIVAKTTTQISAYDDSNECPGMGQGNIIEKVWNAGLGKWCDNETQTSVELLNPCQEIDAQRRVHAALVDEKNCLYEIDLDCCDEEEAGFDSGFDTGFDI